MAAVKDTEYYELLGVPVTATPADIKKGYYKAAIASHPDKNPGDKNAEEKFKKVSEAYQVLSNPELKERYDKYGKEAASGNAEINPKEFFNMIFGGGKFENYVGELAVLSEMDQMMSAEGQNMDQEATLAKDAERQEARKKRVKKLTGLMIVRLQPFVEGEISKFERDMVQEAEELASESFGPELLEALGYIYELKAQQQLSQLKVFGLTLRNPYHGVRERMHNFKGTVSTIAAVVDMQITAQEMMKAEEKGVLDDEKKQQFEQEAALKMISTMWRFNKLEVEAVLREVCVNVLEDDGVDRNVRRKRAEALRLLGKIFRRVAAAATATITALLAASSSAAGTTTTTTTTTATANTSASA